MPPHTASFALEPAPPFRLDLTVWTLRRRLDNLFDRWDGKTYLRVLIEDDKPFEIAVMQLGESKSPQLRVALTGKTLTSKTKAFVTVALERLLGIKIDLQKFYRLSKKDQWLEPFVSQFQGMKPPRLLTPFEALVNAIACQQLTLTMGIRLLNRLTEAYGMALKTEAGIVHAFPRPQDLANADIEDLRKMGFSYQKARYLTNISRFIVDGELNLDTIAQLDDKEAVARLCELKGVGRWTAEYVLLRGLGRTHIFPADDVGARNNLQRWLDLSGTMTYDNTREALSRWDGYGGLVYFHLLLKSLTEKGWIGGGYVEDQARV
ncbi:MAG: DNA-3-methyladenine glycosylase 2 family protein [Chloroflexi bacterium]|nr:DNA-3-methyladenine glycosylase 2 family protein [Chloroflexota bacterium]MBI3340676.1 DNA-3-methyladenine glycosylase 2 family protein [Chloroflexota bacterium]